MKRLFDDKDEWTSEGRIILDEFEEAILTILEKYPNHSGRDLEYACNHAASSVCLDRVLFKLEGG